MLPIIAFIILGLAVSYFVVSPIVQARVRSGNLGEGQSNHSANDLVERKETIYAAIKDIEFDYQMGKLSEEDFNELRQQYKNEAVGLLKEIDEIQHRDPGKRSGRQKRVTKKPPHSVSFCWECGEGVAPSDTFCGNCGNRLRD